MAKVRVKFFVSPKTPRENLFIVGSTSSLGYWDPKKATQLKFNEETNSYYCMKYLPVDEEVEFIILEIIDDEDGEQCTLKTVDDEELYAKIGDEFVKIFTEEFGEE